MSILHRRRAVIDRQEDRAARGGKRISQPAEFPRSSEQPPVPHERQAASLRELAHLPATKPRKATAVKRKKASPR
jgi:hypothetical protein